MFCGAAPAGVAPPGPSVQVVQSWSASSTASTVRIELRYRRLRMVGLLAQGLSRAEPEAHRRSPGPAGAHRRFGSESFVIGKPPSCAAAPRGAQIASVRPAQAIHLDAAAHGAGPRVRRVEQLAADHAANPPAPAGGWGRSVMPRVALFSKSLRR